MTKEDIIIKLTDTYYTLVNADYHKDRDCHFYINKVWSYGEPAYYRVEHYGYIYDYESDLEFNSYEEAEEELIRVLSGAILEQCKWIVASSQEDEVIKEFYNKNKQLIDGCLTH